MALNFLKSSKEKLNHKLTFKEIFSILGLFAVWRIILQFVAYLGIFRLNLNPDFTSCWKPEFPSWYTWWIRWDSGWYLSVAERGYYFEGAENFSNVSFFPLYPLFIKYLGWIFGENYLLCGVIVSNLALLFACFYLYKLAKLDNKSPTAFRSVFYLLIFPAAVFFASMYTESLFLLTCLAAFYHARKNEWTLSCVWGMLAALTKSLGVFLVLALLLEYLEQRKFNFKKIRWNILNLALVPCGLGAFMWYLWKRFGNAWLFLQAQKAWNRSSSVSLTNIGRSVSGHIKDIWGQEPNMAIRITEGFELFSFILFILLCVVVFLKLRKSYALYMACGLILSPLTGSLMSMNRYVLVLFPAFILLALWGKNRVANYAIVMLFSMLLALNTIMFVNSYWVG